MNWNLQQPGNYKVFYSLLSALFLFTTNNLKAQDDFVSIYGNYTYTEVETDETDEIEASEDFDQEDYGDHEEKTDNTELIELLKKLAKDKNVKVKAAVATNLLTPSATLTSLSKNKNVRVKGAAASNPNLPTKEISKLITSKDTLILKAVASNIECTSEDLVKLLSTGNLDIDYTVIRNPNIPESYFQTIINNTDKDNVLLAALAANSATPSSSLLQLAEMDNYIYLPIVLSNAGAPLNSIIPQLVDPFKAEDTVAGVSLLMNPAVGVEQKNQLTDYIGYEVMNSMASDPMSPAEILRKLANLKNAKIRKSVAANISSPVDLLRDLSEDINKEVRINVATNPSNSLGVLKKLAQDENKEVRMAVTLNNITTNEMMLDMYDEVADLLVYKGVMRDYMPDDIVRKLIDDPRVDVRFGLALFSDASPKVLSLLSDDEDDKVREAVAVHKNLDRATLLKLSNDPYINVRNGIAINSITPLIVLADIASRSDNDPYLLADIVFNPNASQQLVDDITKNMDDELFGILETRWKTLASQPETSSAVIARMYKLLPNAIITKNKTIKTNYVAPDILLDVMSDTIVQDWNLQTVLYNLKPLDFSVAAFNYFSAYFYIHSLDEDMTLADTQMELLEIMKEDNKYLDKLVLASREATSSDLLSMLYQLGDSRIKHLVAANASIEPTLFESLKYETDDFILCGVAQNPLMSISELNDFMKIAKNKGNLVKIGAASRVR